MTHFDFLFISIGAFILWMLNGFKGSFNDYLTRPREFTWKSVINYLIGLVIFLLIAKFVLNAFSINLLK